MKKYLIKLSIILLIMTSIILPQSVFAKGNSASSIDWSKPVRVKLIEQKSNNLFTVQYDDDTKFDVSMIGIDIANKYTLKRYKQEGEELKEYNVNYTESEIFSDLQRSGTVVLEADSSSSLKNKDGVIQAWFWSKGQLVQAMLVGEGRAKIDDEICDYTSCDFHYEILKAESENAEKQSSGIYGAKDIEYLKNVGGTKTMTSSMQNMLVIIPSIIAVVLLIALILVLIVSKDSEKKKAKKEAKANKKAAKLEAKNAKKEAKLAKKENKKKKDSVEKVTPVAEEQKTENVIEEKTENIEPPVIASENNPTEVIKEAKNDVQDTDVETPVETTIETSVEESVISTGNEISDQTAEVVNTEIQESNVSEESSDNEDNLQPMPTTKRLALKTVTTMFDSKDEKSKETPEIINIEFMIIGDEGSYKELFVKPMRHPELSNLCKDRTGYAQSNIDFGLLLEEAITELLEISRDCEEVYVWGTNSVTALLEDAKTKLTDVDYNRLEYLLEKAINYKSTFAEAHNTKPCGLVKALEMLNLEKEESQVKMMERLYLADKE